MRLGISEHRPERDVLVKQHLRNFAPQLSRFSYGRQADGGAAIVHDLDYTLEDIPPRQYQVLPEPRMHEALSY